ncbi:MAG TPA: YafY family protein [Blastocatellia bacterium]|nr:YafY family protein [Blastocatellia bacterium]
MRADRLVSIMLLLQVHRRMTARELARRVEVSERTIHRDMDALSAAGIPVVAERGAGGGWMLVEGYRTNLTGLKEAEVQALFLTQPVQVLSDLKLDKASEAAMLKLLAALPSAHRRDADYARQRIHVDVTGWSRYEEAIPFLPTIQEAVWRERKLRINYQRGADCDDVERLIDPLGLVAKRSAWYLVAAVDGDVRSYRVSRVLDATMTDLPFTRPKDFDLATYWRQSTTVFKDHLPRYPALLRVSPDAFPLVRYAGRFARVEQVLDRDPDGWTRVAMRFQFEKDAAEWVLSFGTEVEVIEPAELGERVLAMAESVVTAYRSRNEGAVGDAS